MSAEQTMLAEPRCASCGGRKGAAIHSIKGLRVSHDFVAPEPAEALAKQFHETYERIAPSFGYETREASAKPWAEVPENNRRLMTAVCGEVCASLLSENARLQEALRVATKDSERLEVWQEIAAGRQLLLVAYRTGSHSRADVALSRLEKAEAKLAKLDATKEPSNG